MEDALMLYTGHVVPLSEISDKKQFDPWDLDILFFENGRVRRFKKNGVCFMAIFDDETKDFVGYYEEKKFWEYNYKTSQDKKNSTADLGTLFLYRFEEESIVLFSKLDENKTKVFLCEKWINYSDINKDLTVRYGYKLLKDVSKTFTFLDIPNSSFSTQIKSIFSSLTSYANYVIGKKRLMLDNTLENFSSQELDVLWDIVYVLNEIESDATLKSQLRLWQLYEPFEAHMHLEGRYAPANGTIDSLYHNIYNDEFFATFRIKLIEFRYWILSYKNDYSKIDQNSLVVYLVNIFPPEELAYLHYDTKVSLLFNILKNNYWLIGNWYFNNLNEEEAVLKIVKSIAKINSSGVLNPFEINYFLDLLNSRYLGDDDNDILFKVLYDKVHDNLLFGDDGKGNLGQLINIIYFLWQESKYNPQNSNTTIADAAMSHFTYTHYSAVSKAVIEYPYQVRVHIDKTASPIMLSYEAAKYLVWYENTCTFSFDSELQKIVAHEPLERYGPMPFGYYDIFQPVALKASNLEGTIIKMPVKGIANVNDPSNIDFINNAIPVFFLYYTDELSDYSNAKETIGTAADIVLTFSGIGNITKLRHLRHATLITRLQVLTAAEKVLLYQAIGGLTATAEILAGAASFFHKMATTSCTVYYNNGTPPNPGDPTYNEYNYCQEVNLWLGVLEMATLSVDLLTQRALRKASQRLLDKMPTPTNTEEQAAKLALEQMVDLDGVVNKFLTEIQSMSPPLQNVFTKISGMPNIQTKYAFVTDFETQMPILKRLEMEPDLIDKAWMQITKIPAARKDIDVLIAYKRLSSKPWELEHVTTLFYRGSHPKGGHMYDIISSGEAKFFPYEVPPTTYSSINGHLKCENLYFKRPVGATQGGVELPPGSGNWFMKKHEHYILNPTWDTQRVKEEIAFAHGKAKLYQPTKFRSPSLGQNMDQATTYYRSTFSDGTPVELMIRNYDKDPISGNIKFDHISLIKIL